ncbi:MAG: hypothetical protein QF654_13055 [Alphaproteobacteria bacterium]|jgi:hypothetical protein|nr:hypothetical protein [Alphaproteobacteria bacterium]|tara:strand:- start:202 stop:543 length:342 start_codon:yes stop_codon:yes gene_type:complete
MEDPLRSYIWGLLQPGKATGRTHVVVSTVLVASILATVIIRLVATMKGLDPGLYAALDAVADGISVLFTVEYVVRLGLAPEGDPDPTLAPWKARRDYLISPLGVADLLAAAPF